MAGIIVKAELAAYRNALGKARMYNPKVHANVSPADEVVEKVASEFQRTAGTFRGVTHANTITAFYSHHCHIRLVKDGNVVTGGFVVLNGILLGLWSETPGNGDWLVREAVALGADQLDCFDGYLLEFYAKHGFRELSREPNWDEALPDVVWMGR